MLPAPTVALITSLPPVAQSLLLICQVSSIPNFVKNAYLVKIWSDVGLGFQKHVKDYLTKEALAKVDL